MKGYSQRSWKISASRNVRHRPCVKRETWRTTQFKECNSHAPIRPTPFSAQITLTLDAINHAMDQTLDRFINRSVTSITQGHALSF